MTHACTPLTMSAESEGSGAVLPGAAGRQGEGCGVDRREWCLTHEQCGQGTREGGTCRRAWVARYRSFTCIHTHDTHVHVVYTCMHLTYI